MWIPSSPRWFLDEGLFDMQRVESLRVGYEAKRNRIARRGHRRGMPYRKLNIYAHVEYGYSANPELGIIIKSV